MHNLEIPNFANRGEEYLYLEKNRWPTGEVVCPRCQNPEIIPLGPGYYRCRPCTNAYGHNPFNATIGTSLCDYRAPLRMFLYAAYVLNLGKYGLSTLGLSEKLNVTIVTSHRICVRLGALNREGMGHILGPFAPKYPRKIRTLKGHNALFSSELPYLANTPVPAE